MNRIVIPKSLSGPSLLVSPLSSARSITNNVCTHHDESWYRARSSSAGGIQLPALLCLIKLNYNFNRQKLLSHIWLFQLLTALLASHSINWASFPADFLSFIPFCLQIFASLCWIISRRWSHLSEQLAWKIWSAVRFGIQTSLQLLNDLPQPRISGIK